MRKDQVDFVNATVWIPDSKTPNGIAEIPLTPLALEAFKSQALISGIGPFLFPRDKNPRSEEHTSELQSHSDLVCRLLLEKKKRKKKHETNQNKKKNRNLYNKNKSSDNESVY